MDSMGVEMEKYEGGGESNKNRLVTGSTKVQQKITKTNIYVQGDNKLSHVRTYVCTDEANSRFYAKEKANNSKQVITSAIYLTEVSTEIDGGEGIYR